MTEKEIQKIKFINNEFKLFGDGKIELSDVIDLETDLELYRLSMPESEDFLDKDFKSVEEIENYLKNGKKITNNNYLFYGLIYSVIVNIIINSECQRAYLRDLLELKKSNNMSQSDIVKLLETSVYRSKNKILEFFFEKICNSMNKLDKEFMLSELLTCYLSNEIGSKNALNKEMLKTFNSYICKKPVFDDRFIVCLPVTVIKKMELGGKMFTLINSLLKNILQDEVLMKRFKVPHITKDLIETLNESSDVVIDKNFFGILSKVNNLCIGMKNSIAEKEMWEESKKVIFESLIDIASKDICKVKSEEVVKYVECFFRDFYAFNTKGKCDNYYDILHDLINERIGQKDINTKDILMFEAVQYLGKANKKNDISKKYLENISVIKKDNHTGNDMIEINVDLLLKLSVINSVIGRSSMEKITGNSFKEISLDNDSVQDLYTQIQRYETSKMDKDLAIKEEKDLNLYIAENNLKEVELEILKYKKNIARGLKDIFSNSEEFKKCLKVMELEVGFDNGAIYLKGDNNQKTRDFNVYLKEFLIADKNDEMELSAIIDSFVMNYDRDMLNTNIKSKMVLKKF